MVAPVDKRSASGHRRTEQQQILKIIPLLQARKEKKKPLLTGKNLEQYQSLADGAFTAGISKLGGRRPCTAR